MSEHASIHVVYAALKLGAELQPLHAFRGEKVVLWGRAIAFAYDGEPGWFVSQNKRGNRLYHRIRRQEQHRVNMSWSAYREEYEARVARMRSLTRKA